MEAPILSVDEVADTVAHAPTPIAAEKIDSTFKSSSIGRTYYALLSHSMRANDVVCHSQT